MKIFEYAVLKAPTDKEAEDGKTDELLIPITAIMAVDKDQAVMLAGRAIPEAELANIDRITVAVRPF